MASSMNSDIELLTEHFGYPPVSLLDDIINSVNILAERALNSVEQALLRQPPASLGFKPAKKPPPDAKAKAKSAVPADAQHDDVEEDAAAAALRLEVENGTHQLETLLCASIDRNFDKFELYVMRNILCVRPADRPWLRLSHYAGLDLEKYGRDGGEAEAAAEAEAEDAAIAHLHRRLQASRRLGHLLDREVARNDALLARLRRVAAAPSIAHSAVKTETDVDTGTDTGAGASSDAQRPTASAASLAFLLDRGPLTESDAEAPLTTTTAFALAQLPALRQLSSELRQMAPGLAAMAAEEAATEAATNASRDDDDDDADDDNDKSWRRARLEYIEGATRKHLERVRGLALGRNGDVRGRSAADAGPGADPNSGAALDPEALTNILGLLRQNHTVAAAATNQPDEPPEETGGEAMDES
ncbi:mind kinetochore complex component [Niveomyces insectorum RCEF 264]|uniref:Mind kinetochore complex component n=1 Tax=Niveomyces insectorum RCEF 264 TaxID=1081102 RepID=A0A167Y2P2_9HYPO|nr:mind kinetochore complex component [Niveomyces insectorum RCEF 264]